MKFLNYIFLLLSANCLSQTAFKAVLTDESNSPVAYAGIFLPESNSSTISNEDGSFYIVFNPVTDKVLHISHLNYEDMIIDLSRELPEKIVLKQRAMLLKEVVINSPLTANEIALNMISNLDKNHNADPTYYEYFRRVVYYGSDRKTVTLVQEFYGNALHTAAHKAKANILKSRAVSYNIEGDKIFEKLMMHDFFAMIGDNMLLYKPAFLQKSKLKNYDITLDGITTLNGRECYILRLNNENEDDLESKKAVLYIDTETYGIIKLISGDYTESSDYCTIRNFSFTGDKWTMVSATERRLKLKQPKISTTLYTKTEDKDETPADNLKPVGKGISHRLKKQLKNTNDTFWNNYRHIPLP